MTVYDVDKATFTGGSAGSDRSRARMVVVVTAASHGGPVAPDAEPRGRDYSPHDR